MKEIGWLIGYFLCFCTIFIVSDSIITYCGDMGIAIIQSFLAYLLFGGLTPLFYHFYLDISYGKGLLWMCASMIVAGLFIFAAFGDGDYSSDFYKYEFVCAGLWFGLVNLLCMLSIRLFRRLNA